MRFLKSALKIGGCVGIALAIAVFAVSFFTFRHTQSFLKSAIRTQGIVVKLDGGRVAYPIFMYHDAAGREHEIESSVGQNPTAYKVGEAITVLYQKDKPEDARINDFFDIWGGTIMLDGFGIIVFGIGFVLLLVGVKMDVPVDAMLFGLNRSSNMPKEATLEISYPKALLVSGIQMAIFVIALWFLGIPMRKPLLIGFLVCMVIGMSFVFAGCFCFMLRCKIGYDGLRPAAPTFYQRVLRWEDMMAMHGSVYLHGPFYLVKGRDLGQFCILPRPFLLKRPESLREFIQRYAPEDNIVRTTLAT